MSARDKQFKGFAKALLDELLATDTVWIDDMSVGGWRAEWEPLIARRAYDLAYHATLRIDERDCDVLGFDEAVRRIPDLTELPEEQE